MGLESLFRKITDYKWELPKSYKPGMRVPAIFYINRKLMQILEKDAVEQAANVATLPGIQKASLVMPDVHVGYGFPIGGVAGFDVEEGIVSPGGVGFDINCLSPNSSVLTEHGYWVRIEDLPASGENVKVYDVEEGHNDSGELAFVSARSADDKAVRITTEFGRVLEGSLDHPVLTRKGYKKLGEIKEGDEVVVYPFEGVEFEQFEGTILSEDDFKGYDAQVVKYLKERKLIPLRYEDKRIGTIARLLGFAFGDGCIVKSGKRLTLEFYGKLETLEEVAKDLESLGVKASKAYSRRRRLKIRSPYSEYYSDCTDCRIRVTARSFAILMHKLGLPIGKKTEQPYRVPDWIKKAPLWVKRNFLAGLFGADGSKVVFKGYTPLPINLTQSKSKEFESNLREFMEDVRNLLREFEIESTIYEVKSLNGVTLRLAIVGEENVRKFLAKIGYEYSREKKELGLLALEYLKRKKSIKELRAKAIESAREIHERTGSLKKACAVCCEYVNRRLVERALYENVEDVRVPENFPTFEEFVERFGASGGFVYDRVVRVETIEPEYDLFYDIGVLHKAHNFIANGIVVHNCGVRLIRSNLTVDDVRPKIKELIDELFVAVPSGVGSEGRLRVSDRELDEILVEGAKWAVENGYGYEKDLEHCEENGALEGAKPEVVSRKARERGRPQLGTLGSGNHFLEVQYVEKVYDEECAKVMGLEEGMVTVMVHCGSRGLGHQVCSDFLVVLDRAVRKYGIKLPDRQLACAPINSKEGQDYFGGMAASANYAWCNRQIITHWVRETFQKVFRMSEDDLGMELVYDVAHNIAKFETHKVNGKKMKLCVHRKGATRAFGPGHPDIPKDYQKIGQPVLIPGSMGTPSYVLVGTEKAMEETFGSTCHGSGRVMSRAAAKRRLRGDQVKNRLLKQGIYVRATHGALLAEEAPEAYKMSDDVVEVVHRAGISKIVARLRPLGVAKG
ncbi:intein-containing RctB family protein [Archaeoglobus sp.]